MVSGTLADASGMPSGEDGAKIRVVLADDSYLVRAALERILEEEQHIELVAMCADRSSLLAAIRRERPRVVITDIRMPPALEDEGIEVANSLRETDPDIGVVVLSQYAEPHFGLALLEHGSDGRAYLLKERVHDRHQLIAAIDVVARGGSLMDAKIVEAMIERSAARANSPLDELSARELEILAGIAKGKSNARIAEDLVLTKRAIEKHINGIFLKLGLSHAEDVSRRVKAALIYLSADHD